MFRSGRVRIDGVEHAPLANVSPRVFSSGALVLPQPGGQALAAPVPAPEDPWLVGMELDTFAASSAVRVDELVLDGQLAPSGVARCDANVILLDVTPGESAAARRSRRTARPRRATTARSWRSTGS